MCRWTSCFILLLLFTNTASSRKQSSWISLGPREETSLLVCPEAAKNRPNVLTFTASPVLSGFPSGPGLDSSAVQSFELRRAEAEQRIKRLQEFQSSPWIGLVSIGITQTCMECLSLHMMVCGLNEAAGAALAPFAKERYWFTSTTCSAGLHFSTTCGGVKQQGFPLLTCVFCNNGQRLVVYHYTALSSPLHLFRSVIVA